MVQENIIEMMALDIKVVFSKDYHKEMAKKYLIMDQFLLVFIQRAKKSMVNIYGKMEIFIKVTFIMIFFMDMVFIDGEMREAMKEIGKMVKWMEKEN